MRNAWRVLRYARPYGRRLVLILAITALVAGIELLRPWPMKVLVDNVLGDEPVPGALAAVARALPGPPADGLLVLVVAGGLLIYLAGALLSMALTVTAVAIGRRMTYDLAADVFAHYQRLSLRFHARRSVGDSLTRVVGDSYCPEVLVSSALVPVLEALLTLVGMLVVMWLLSPELTLLSLAVVPFLFLVIKGFAKPMRDRSRTALDLQGRMASVVEETLGAVPAVQAFTREAVETERFRAYAGRTLAAELRSTVTDMRFRLFAGLVTAVGTAALVFAGARLAQDGTVTVGTILVFLGYLAALYAPLDSLTYSASNVQQATAQADRVMEVLDTAPEVADPPHARPRRLGGGVRFEAVTFGYEPGQPVLHDVSLEVEPGGTVAIVGPTGAGKSTLVSFLVRFNDPWSGRVLIGGEDVREMSLRSLREQVALVLQEPFIFPMTVAENIAYGRVDADRGAIVAAARAANAHEFIARLPQGYDTVVGQRGATLSGGEKQRLSIARAFLKDAPILVLDEPTSALDARTEGFLLDALDRLMRDRITFVVAHRLSTIHNADQILVLDEGRIVERGAHAELVAAGGLYARLYRRQGQFTQHELASGSGR